MTNLPIENIKEVHWTNGKIHILYKDNTKFIANADEIKLMADFICKNHSCDKGEFELRVNRMFLDNPSKPKRWAEIMEILSSCNL
jgi:hypothetical protein